MESQGKHFNWPKIQPGFAHMKNKSENKIPVFPFPHQNRQSLNIPAECHEKSQNLYHPSSPPLIMDLFGIWRISMFLDNIITLKRVGFVSNLPKFCFKPALPSPQHNRSCSGAIIDCSLFLCSQNPLNLVGNEEGFGLTHSLCWSPPSPEFQSSSPQLFPANKFCSICKRSFL